MAEETLNTPTPETPETDTPESPDLYPAGLAALKAEREARKELERQTKTLQKQLRELQAKVSPEQAEQLQKLEQVQAEYEQRLQSELKVRQAAHEKQVRELQQLAEEKTRALTQETVGRAYAAAFIAAGGRTEPGFADALQRLVGDRLQLVDGVLTVMENGSPVLGDGGKPVDAATWLAGLKQDPLYGHFFAPTPQGFGGGTPPQIPGMAAGSGSMSAIDLLKFGLGG